MKKIIIPFFCAVLFAAPAAAQQVSTVPAGTVTKSKATPKEVIDNYIKALGGKDKLQSVRTVVLYNSVTAAGLPAEVTMVTKKMGNKFKSEQSVMGQKMVQLFDGEKGYFEQMGMKKDLPADKMAELRKSKVIDALAYDPANYSSVSVESLNGKDYEVLTSAKGKFYFDKATGLLYKTSAAEGDALINSYMSIEGIKFPQEIEAEGGGQKLTIRTTKVVLNAEVTDADFK